MKKIGVRYRDIIDIITLNEKEAKELQELIGDGGLTDTDILNITDYLAEKRKKKTTKTFKVNFFIDLTEPTDEQFADTKFW